ncbi:aldo/keto reductase [Halobacillus shinanisalinarum]|uniref:Aldo/keto reductase n=1 Tax=Halobacillus shinanisalinarum TaxID=2932258 RepID=A0ABY4H088_9BACI|nr:aldo/keto reductase [Halobacillus shinanisalinarum]UOQ93320.1 aldo/keto reductase [Halobacillus shinanisalinarum]
MAEKTRIGTTDLYVNPIGLGTNAVGGHNLYPNLDEQQGVNMVKEAVENGVDFLDTAYIYGPGYSEELVGKAIREMGNRSEIVLATKGAQKFVNGEEVLDNSPAFLKQSVEDSLKRLKTDYLDMYYIHFPDENTPKAEAVGALKELKDEGKIRSIGVSNMSLDQLKEANQDGYVDVFQGLYNLFQRDSEKELFPYIVENEISFVPFFPLASGLLAGKYDKYTTFPDSDLRSSLPHFQEEAFKENLEKVEELRKIADRKGVEVPHLVLAWYLEHEAIDVIIPGAKNKEQVKSNLQTLEVKISNQEFDEIDQLFT